MSDRDESPDASAYTGKGEHGVYSVQVCPEGECREQVVPEARVFLGVGFIEWICPVHGKVSLGDRWPVSVEVVPCEALEAAERERDEMRHANITEEDTGRPLGQSVEFWQDRCLDHATALDAARIRLHEAELAIATTREALRDLLRVLERFDNAPVSATNAIDRARAALSETVQPDNERSEG